MKNIALLFALLVVSRIGNAQGDTSNPTPVAEQKENPGLRPVKGDRAMSFNFVGIYNLALPSTIDTINGEQLFDLRYFFKDRCALRLGFGFDNFNETISATNDTTGGQPLVDSERTRKNSFYSISLGAEKHIHSNSKTVDAFYGGSILYSKVKGRRTVNTIRTTQTNGDYVETVDEVSGPGASAITLRAHIGFFWFFAKNVALGGEFALAFVNGRDGGDVNGIHSTTSSTGGVVTSSSYPSSTTKKTEFSVFETSNMGTVNLLIKF